MFHAVIRKRGRVPASNTFVARRTAGPGLASNYFYQVGIFLSCVVDVDIVSELLCNYVMRKDMKDLHQYIFRDFEVGSITTPAVVTILCLKQFSKGHVNSNIAKIDVPNCGEQTIVKKFT